VDTKLRWIEELAAKGKGRNPPLFRASGCNVITRDTADESWRRGEAG